MHSPHDQEVKQPIISLKDVAVAYQDTIALHDINLDVYEHQFLGIAGANGSGKTTLLKTILGALQPYKGTIHLKGKDITKHISRKDRFKLGYVPQMNPIDRNFPALVEDVVAMGRFAQIGVLGRVKHRDKELIQQALETVEMLDYACRPIGHLSGGQQQKVWIARALAQNAEILLLDEPTSALDFKMTRSVLDLLKKLHQEQHMTIIMIQHNLNLMKQYVNRMLYLNKTIYYDGDPERVLSDEEVQQVFYI